MTGRTIVHDTRMADTNNRPAGTTARRRVDPHRRQRIIEATVKVITKHGISELSHRLVARTAGVPLSATSYYFGNLDDLVEAAFASAIEHDRELMRERLQRVPEAADPIAEIAALTRDMISDRDAGVLAMELFVAALRREPLRLLLLSWDAAFYESLVPYLGDAQARKVTTLMAGIVQRGLITDVPLSVQEIEQQLRDPVEA